MNIIKILAGCSLIIPLAALILLVLTKMTIPFLIETGILIGIFSVFLTIVIGLVLVAIIMMAKDGFNLIKEGKNQ